MKQFTKRLRILIVLLACALGTQVQALELTVSDGTETNGYVPIYGLYVDNYFRSQIIYPQDSLTAMNGQAIMGLTFYTSLTNHAWGLEFELKLAEVEDATLPESGFSTVETETVYTGSMDVVSNEVTIVLDEPFVYRGGNLLVEITNLFHTTSYQSINFYGVSGHTGVSAVGYSSYSTPSTVNNKTDFLPKVKFEYDAPPTCLKISNLRNTATAADGGSFSWTPAGEEPQWQIVAIEQGGTLDWSGATKVNEPNGTLTGLLPNTLYDVYVRAYCSDTDQGSEIKTTFRTDCAPLDITTFNDSFDDGLYCYHVGNPTSTNTEYIPSIQSVTSYAHTGSNSLYFESIYSSYNPSDSAYVVLPELDFGAKQIEDYSIVLYARNAGSSENYSTTLLLGVLTDSNDISTFHLIKNLNVNTTTYERYECDLAAAAGVGSRLVLLAILDPESSATYPRVEIYVDDISFIETPACQPLSEISLSDIGRREMTVNMTPKRGLSLSTMDIVWSAVELDEAGLEAASKTTIDAEASYVISGLERETTYYVYVRSNCGAAQSEWVSASGTTKGLADCINNAVGTGTASANLLFTTYGNTYSQQIYTAEELHALGYQAGQITSVSFNYTATPTLAKTQSIYIGATTQSSFAGNTATDFISGLSLVFEPKVIMCENGWLEYPFATPFDWDGESNIVVGVLSNSSAGNASGWSTAGTTLSEYRAIYRYKDYTPIDIDDLASVDRGDYSRIRPNIKFKYCFDLAPCPAVSDLDWELVGAGTTEANFSWDIHNADYLSSFDGILSTTEITDFTEAVPTHANLAASARSLNINTLEPATHYYFYLRANCKAEDKDEGSSDWVGTDFTTLANCPAVVDLAVELVGQNKVSLSWGKAFDDQELHFQYIASTEELDEAGLAAATAVAVDDTLAVRVENLQYDQDYFFYVASVCGSDHSAYKVVTAKTLVSCLAVVDLQASRTEHNRVVLTWGDAQFSEATEWEVGIVGNEANAVVVNEHTATLIGLSAETEYTAYVRTVCSESDKSEAQTVSFTTATTPGDCATIGTGLSTSSLYPIATYYKYSYSQQIFEASELSGGNILALSLQYNSTSEMTKTTGQIFVGHTDKNTFASSSDWVPATELTKVYEGSLNCKSGWNEFTFDIPFEYNGSDNLVVAIYKTSGIYESTSLYFNTTAGSGNKTIYYYSDGTDCTPDSPGSGSTATSRSNIQFCYEPSDCPVVTALQATDIEAHQAKLSWEPMGADTEWNVILSDTAIVDFSSVSSTHVTEMTQVVSGLLAEHDYYYYVQPNCLGKWKSVKFTTIPSCYTPTSIGRTEITAHTAKISWTDTHDAGAYTVIYGPSATFDIADAATYTSVDATEKEVVLTNLLAETAYTVAVKSVCDIDDESKFSSTATFATIESCFAPTSLTATDMTAHTAILGWTDTHEAGTYHVAYGLTASFDIEDSETFTEITVTDTTKVLISNLRPYSNYSFVVRSDCDSEGEGLSHWSSRFDFTTGAGIPFEPVFTSTTLPSDWQQYKGLADNIFAGGSMTSTTSAWPIVATDTIIEGYHFKVNNYGGYVNNWVISPVIDATEVSDSEQLLMHIDLGLTPYNENNRSKRNDGTDDKFMVIVQEVTESPEWSAANATVWSNDGEGDFSYNDIPEHGTTYNIDLSQFAGKNFRIALYVESTVSNADNYLYAGNINIDRAVIEHFSEEVCKDGEFDNHGIESATSAVAGKQHFETYTAAEGSELQHLTTLDLTVNAPSATDENAEVYVGDHYQSANFDIESVELTDAESHKLTLSNAAGCDSIISLHLTIHEATIHEKETVVSCGDYEWRERILTAAGEYLDTIRTSLGGISDVYSIELTIAQPTASNESAEVYVGDHFVSGDLAIDIDAETELTQIAHLTNVSGCDSTITWTLDIKTVELHEAQTEDACSQFEWRGKVLTESRQYFDTIRTELGGDKEIFVLNLTINQPAAVAKTAEVYVGDHFVSGNFEIDITEATESTQVENLQTINGCDSIVTWTLTIKTAEVHEAQVEAACSEFTWAQNSATYTESGLYYDTIRTELGGDKEIFVLNLTINQPAAVAKSAEVYVGDHFVSDNFQIDITEDTESTQVENLQTINGCDSIVTWTLTIKTAEVHEAQVEAACSEFTWAQNSATYTESGLYYDTIRTELGGDKEIFVLNLTINQPSAVAKSAEVYVGDHFVSGNFEIDITEDTEVTQVENMQTINGCDSIVTWTLTIKTAEVHEIEKVSINKGGEHEWRGNSYTEAGTYTDTIYTDFGGAKEIFTLELTVLDPTDPTGLNNVSAEDGVQIQKVVRNHQVYIIRNGEWFDMVGRKVDPIDTIE